MQLEDVSFRYLPDRPLIEDLFLDVKPGQRIAIVGPTGCGKTTLINLLMRFYDVNGGSIKVSGTDIRDVTRASLRGSYGMVLQDTWLRAGTVRENIAYGKPDASLEEIVAAAKAAMQTASSAACRRLRYRHRRGRRQHQSGPEAAAVHCPRDALPAADADPGRSNILH